MSYFRGLKRTELEEVASALKSRGMLFLLPAQRFDYSHFTLKSNSKTGLLATTTVNERHIELAETVEVWQIEVSASRRMKMTSSGEFLILVRKQDQLLGHAVVRMLPIDGLLRLSQVSRSSPLSQKVSAGIQYVDNNGIDGYVVRLVMVPFLYRDFFWCTKENRDDLYIELDEESSNCKTWNSKEFWALVRSSEAPGVLEG